MCGLKLGIVLIAFLTSVSAVASGPQCASLFESQTSMIYRPMDRVSKSVVAFQMGKQDTTSLRQETKFVVTEADLNKQLEVLSQAFGERFKDRDKAPEGFVNITSTYYMTIVKFVQDGLTLSAKPRFREYFTRALSDVNWKNLNLHPELVDRMWWELKIQHSKYANVVFKPRLQIYRKDVDKLITEKYVDYREGIIERLKEINPGKEGDIEKFKNFYDALYSSPNRKKQHMLARTQYERKSFSIKLKNPNNPNEKIDVQITIDKGVRLTRLHDQRKFWVFQVGEMVVEVKIPLAYANLNPGDLAAVPELAAIKSFVETMTAQHISKYPINRGKMSKIDKKNDMENDSDLDNDWD